MSSLPGYIDTDNKEFQTAYRLVTETNQSVFLTGRAGTGKSTFLRYICQHIKKKYVVLAPTGIAAINAGGQTIHSFFKAPFRPILPDDPDLSTKNGRIFDFLKYRKSHRKLIEELDIIIIDEISMVRADLMDFIDRVLRIYCGNLRVPFGGKQLLLVGDVFQLEPVVVSDERSILSRFYANPFFFSAHVFKQITLVSIELTKVYRQNELSFVNLLDRVRVNNASHDDLRQLNHRLDKDFNPPMDEFFVTLAARKNTVDFINENQLAQLKSETFHYEGKITGKFHENNLPTPLHLELKEDAQVMFIKNDVEKRWYNGSIGRISMISKDEIRVILDDGNEVWVDKAMWRNIRYVYDEREKKIVEEELGSYVQYPIRLAWAITIHKSQGLTFDKVIIDLGQGAFSGGQTYVALSRCRSIDGLILRNNIRLRDIFVSQEVMSFAKLFNDKQVYEKSAKEARANAGYVAALGAFRKEEMQKAVDYFAEAVSDRNDLTQSLFRRFLSRELGLFRRLKQQIVELKTELKDTRVKMKEFAAEYYLMGNQCVVKAKDLRAGIANFSKAIELDPYYVDAWIRRGITKMDDDDLDGAEDDLSQAIKLNNRSFKAYYNRGRLRLDAGKAEAALEDLERAHHLKPKHASTVHYLGDAWSKNGEPLKALDLWEKARKLRGRD